MEQLISANIDAASLNLEKRINRQINFFLYCRCYSSS